VEGADGSRQVASIFGRRSNAGLGALSRAVCQRQLIGIAAISPLSSKRRAASLAMQHPTLRRVSHQRDIWFWHIASPSGPRLMVGHGGKADFESDLLIGIFDRRAMSQLIVPIRSTAPDARPYFGK
jgi:hypothetical protein